MEVGFKVFENIKLWVNLSCQGSSYRGSAYYCKLKKQKYPPKIGWKYFEVNSEFFNLAAADVQNENWKLKSKIQFFTTNMLKESVRAEMSNHHWLLKILITVTSSDSVRGRKRADNAAMVRLPCTVLLQHFSEPQHAERRHHVAVGGSIVRRGPHQVGLLPVLGQCVCVVWWSGGQNTAGQTSVI